MKRMLKEEGEEIVYIEYIDGIPHSVITAPVNKEWGLRSFDFEYISNDKKDIWWTQSGMGGKKTELEAPKFSNPSACCYWMADGAKFKGRSKANIKKIHKPLVVKFFGRHQSVNPFKHTCETSHGFTWCEICKEFSVDGEGCREHQEWCVEKSSLVYTHDGSFVK